MSMFLVVSFLFFCCLDLWHVIPPCVSLCFSSSPASYSTLLLYTSYTSFLIFSLTFAIAIAIYLGSYSYTFPFCLFYKIIDYVFFYFNFNLASEVFMSVFGIAIAIDRRGKMIMKYFRYLPRPNYLEG